MNHEYHFEVRLHDVDHAGVMFFARIFTYAHDAYESFMDSLGLDLGALIRQGAPLPIVHAGADYLAPLRHGDDVTVMLEIEALGQTSFTLSYIFRNGEALMAKARTVHVFLEGQRPSPLPENIRQKLLPFCRKSLC